MGVERENNYGVSSVLLVLVILIVLVILVILGVVAVKSGIINQSILEKSLSTTKSAGVDRSPTQVPTMTPASLNEPGHEIDLPESMGKQASVEISSLQSIRDIYDKAREEGGCPGPCSYLIEGDNLDKQFEILNNTAGLEECELTDDIEKDISDFKLFDGGIGSKDIIDVIWNENLNTCGIKFVGADGYDAWLGNYEYQVGFIKDERVVEIEFELFPLWVFPEVDEMWKDIGYVDGSCNLDCNNKQLEYMKEIDFESSMIQSIIKIYDSSINTFKMN